MEGGGGTETGETWQRDHVNLLGTGLQLYSLLYRLNAYPASAQLVWAESRPKRRGPVTQNGINLESVRHEDTSCFPLEGGLPGALTPGQILRL